MQMTTAFADAFAKAMEAMGKFQPQTQTPAQFHSATHSAPPKNREAVSSSDRESVKTQVSTRQYIKDTTIHPPATTLQPGNNMSDKQNRSLADIPRSIHEKSEGQRSRGGKVAGIKREQRSSIAKTVPVVILPSRLPWTNSITDESKSPRRKGVISSKSHSSVPYFSASVRKPSLSANSEKRRHTDIANPDSSDEWRPHNSQQPRRRKRKALIERTRSIHAIVNRSGRRDHLSSRLDVAEEIDSSDNTSVVHRRQDKSHPKLNKHYILKYTADTIPAVLYEAEDLYQKKVAERYKVTRTNPAEREDDDTGIDEDIGSGTITTEELNGAFCGATDAEIETAAEECVRLITEAAEEEKASKEGLWKDVTEWAKADGMLAGSMVLDMLLTVIQAEKKRALEYIRDRSKTLKALLANRIIPPSNPAVPDRTINSSIHLKDAVGESLLVKVNSGMEEPFGNTPAQQIPMHKHIQEAMNRLENAGVHPPEPSILDLRYPQDEFRRTKEFWTSKNKPCGVFHFACWRQPAYPDEPKPWEHSLSSDILGLHPGKFGARVKFLVDMAPIHQAMSLWFEAIDRQRYKTYREQVDRMTRADTGLEAVKFTNNHTFLGMASLRNVQVRNHRDRGDIRDGWVGMTCTGAFTGGELCLPDLDLKLRFLPGDVIFFRGCALQHFINTTVGERSSLVFFSHSGPNSKEGGSKHVTYDYPSFPSPKEPSGPRSSGNINAVAPPMLSRRHTQRIKKRVFSHLPKYPTTKADLTEQKLKRARQRKKRFEGYAKEEFERGSMTLEEYKKVSRVGSHEFYELNLIELARHAKGEYPFAPIEARRKAHRMANK
ncbi:hypothetical protein ONS95_010649 [Cadophora gregata]|uniref:uncharacterized protein n=1 Tax=Cadophora gregata TaxID=51156 RepID=UPI0026DB40F9|nr:uncharacterized protein ONS95_010649 [Cadophora gregata]KAK0122410.1 hypothetical protein ONS95_010649 [Cadophora gregata]KAK0127889.1 hypothetical protein ONS96_007389 [Cadophora gregata f. sp. sojae]